ncbi:MAG: hypothetical protein KC462_03770, partial [Cyanobacteria bacterium HKST-UBA05]|nr:hypothetical protein [Cyanobacteria bacterium HKST-UBA05]
VLGLVLFGCQPNTTSQAGSTPQTSPQASPTTNTQPLNDTAPAAPVAPYTIAANGMNGMTPTSTLADVQKLFGAAHVKPGSFYVGEGVCSPATAVYPNDPAKAFLIVWLNQPQPSAKPYMLVWDLPDTETWEELKGSHGATVMPTSQWHTPQGVRVGSTVADVELANGKPFKLYGIDWDYGGNVTSWEKGTLDTAHHGRLRVRFGPPPTPIGDTSAFSGDAVFSSNHPAKAMKKLVAYRLTYDMIPDERPLDDALMPQQFPCETMPVPTSY